MTDVTSSLVHHNSLKFLMMISVICILLVPAANAHLSEIKPSSLSEGYGIIIFDVKLDTNRYTTDLYVKLKNIGEKNMANIRIFAESNKSDTQIQTVNHIEQGKYKLVRFSFPGHDSLNVLLTIKPPAESGDPGFVFHSIRTDFPSGHVTPIAYDGDKGTIYKFESSYDGKHYESFEIRLSPQLCDQTSISAYGKDYQTTVDKRIKLNFLDTWRPMDIVLNCDEYPITMPKAFPFTEAYVTARIISGDSACSYKDCQEITIAKDKENVSFVNIEDEFHYGLDITIKVITLVSGGIMVFHFVRGRIKPKGIEVVEWT